jgi:BirA family transcriptional regulator, biotin operon repressor / biotin---[acetyl-CoA-carboxylase] ligase
MTADAKILRALRSADAVAAADLARSAGVTDRELRKRVIELQSLGYEITSTPHQGFQLVAAPDSLHADDVMSRLGETRVIGRDIRVFSETTSTNDVVEKLARDGVREGVVVFAESQTKGRGRMGRRWVSPPGKGLWFSVLVRPPFSPDNATQLTVIAATAVARAIGEETGLVPQIKWPNDILLKGRKAVGVLTELAAEVDRIKHVILGIGVDVNVTEFPPELQSIATSLACETGNTVERAALAARILQELDRDYARICAGEFASVAEEWEQQCVTLGRRVRIHIGTRELTGRAEALDPSGALLLRTDHGHLERITGGDVLIEAQ